MRVLLRQRRPRPGVRPVGGLGLALALLLAPALARPAPPDPTVASIHATEQRAHAGMVTPGRPLPKPTTRALLPDAIVYGYLPYWVTDTSQLRLDLLSHVGWFSVDMTSTGTISSRHGWPDTDFVQAAHAAGTKVEVVFTLFSAAGIDTLVGSASYRAAAVAAAVAELESGGADGINIDFEGAPASARDGITSFFCELRGALDAADHTDASISIAGPAVDWADAWNLPALLDCGVNYFFIMGYDFYGGWSGSGVGPSGLLRVTSLWRPTASWSELRSVATWASQVSPDRRRNIVLGVPYYGNQWQTSSAQPGAGNLGHDQSVTYLAARQDLAAAVAPRQWEAGSQTPWYTFMSAGVQRQVWYDDEESLRAKYDMAKEQGLGGVGMWALGYDNGYTELWSLLEDEFTQADPAVDGTRAAPLAIASFPFHDERDTSDPAQAPSNYFNFYGCAATTPEYGREVVYRVDLCQPGTLTATITDGAGVDIDIHLLDGLEEADCLARDDTEVAQALQPGAYYLVADTYVADCIEQAGPFALDVTFAPSSGTPCAADERCVAGTCVAPQADAGVPDDGGAPDDDAPQADARGDAGGPPPADGCGCAAGAPAGGPLAALLLLPFALLARRRR
jgi:spore germination protein YaaH